MGGGRHKICKLLIGLVAISSFLFVLKQQDLSHLRSYQSLGIYQRKTLSEVDGEEISQVDCRKGRWIEGLTPIYMVTPTYRRAEQMPELIRTAQTLLHVPNLIWIVVEDAFAPSPEVEHYLQRSGMNFVLLTAQMPSKFAKSKAKPRGVANRNAALAWIRNNTKTGVVYFGDDDNTYDINLFEEIRHTKSVSMFPVGLVTNFGVSSPIIRNGKVVGFYDGWLAGRRYAIDMAGFAVSVERLFRNKSAMMPYKPGFEEDGFLRNLKVKFEEITPLADGCTEIMVWHTQTKKNNPVLDKSFKANITDTNIKELRRLVWRGK